MRVGSLILAGGRSRRMGQPKESLRIGADSLLGRTARTLLECTAPVVVIARGGDQALPPLPTAVHVLHDEQPDQGPLPAIARGLRWLAEHAGFGDGDAAFVSGCDAPFVTAAVTALLTQRLGDLYCVVPRSDDRLQPLCAVYRLACLPAIDALLARGIATPRTIVEVVPARVLDERDLRAVDPDLRCLRSMNTLADWERARRELEPDGGPSCS